MKGNHIEQMRVKVKENPLQFIIILGCFIFLAFLICAGVVYQSARAKRISREQGTVILEEAGAFRADMEEEIKTLSKQLSEKSTGLAESEQILRELTDEYESSLDTYSMQQISATTESLGTIRESIKNSELLITKIQEGLQNNSADTKALVTEQANELSDKLKEIDKRYEASAGELKSLMDHLGKDQSEAAKEMANKLSEVESNLTKSSKTQVAESAKEIKDAFEKKTDDMSDKLTNQYETLNSNITSSYEDLGNQYDTLSSDLGNRYDTLSSDLGNQYNTLSTDLSGKYDALNSSVAENYTYLQGQLVEFQQTLVGLESKNQSLQEYLEQQFGAVDGKLSQVFQSVSSGKSMLASALLTKGVEIPQDASFNQIKEGILAIPQTIYLGSETQYLPGTISYDYHNHVDGGGNTTGGQSNMGESGGCYTTPIYHTHVDSCYETYSYTDFRFDPIDWHWTNAHTHGNSYTGIPDNCRTCSFCGAHEIYGGHEGHSKRVEYTATGKRLICTKTQGQTIDSYATGCGLSEGQIVGAHIVY